MMNYQRRKRRVIFFALVFLLVVVAATRLPALNNTFGLSDTGITLQLGGTAEPMRPFPLLLSQGGGGGDRTTLTFAPGLMFADSLPANMTAVHYDESTHTLSFAWAPGLPKSATIQLLTATTGSLKVSAVSGSLNESVTITPAENSPAENSPAEIGLAESSLSGSVAPAESNSADPADPTADQADLTTQPNSHPASTSVRADTYAASDSSDPAAVSEAGQTSTASAAPADEQLPAADPEPAVAAAPAAAPEQTQPTLEQLNQPQGSPSPAVANIQPLSAAGAGNGQIQTQVYPLSQSVAPGDDLYFIAIMNAAGINTDYTNASWDITLSYNPAYFNYAFATVFPDLTGPSVSGAAGAETISYKFPASPYTGGVYMSVIDLTSGNATPSGTAVNIASTFNSAEYSVTDATNQIIAAAGNGGTVIIPGDYYLTGGARNGFNYYHMYGYGAVRPGAPYTYDFWLDTFCTHKDYTSAPGSYIYYYNTDPDDYNQDNVLFHQNVLNENTAIKSGIEMTVDQYRDLRYCILYTNVNRDIAGQRVYWSYLGHFIPQRYSAMSAQGALWQDDWLTRYFGAVGANDFMGLGPIADGQDINIGAQVGVQFTQPDPNASYHLDESNPRVGPFKIDWTPGSDPVLAQLNCGPTKNVPPVFNLRVEDSSSAVRFYSSATSRVPITSVQLGNEFYVEYNGNAGLGGTFNVNVTTKNDLITKVLADQFFIHPTSENQINVDTVSERPAFTFAVTVPQKEAPPATDDGYFYVRPTVAKQVAEDNHRNNTGKYVDVLTVPFGTDVLHKMTVTSTDPKGTILTFQNRDFDLFPSKVVYPTLYNGDGAVYGAADADANAPIYDSADQATRSRLTLPANTALVYNAVQFKAAIDANKDIKQMSDITIPSSWVASTTAYSGVFDGNGYLLKGDGGVMTEPVFRETEDAVFYRVSFVDFTVQRKSSGSSAPTVANGSNYVGSLVDYMGSINGQARMINCYGEGNFSFDDNPAIGSLFIGGLVGQVGGTNANVNFAKEVSGVKAKLNVSTTGGANTNYLGGVFGFARTEMFENNELLAGSNITSSISFVGGLSCGVYFVESKGGNKIANCKADYTFTNTMTVGTTRRYGGLVERVTALTEMDRCQVNCNYVAPMVSDLGIPNTIHAFGGLLAMVNATSIPSITFSDCSAVFTGDTIYASNTGNDPSGGTGAGIYNNNGSLTAGQQVVFENCNAYVNMMCTKNGAGIYLDESAGTGPGLTMVNCKSSGSIIAAPARYTVLSGIFFSPYVAGIAVGSKGGQSGGITNCVTDMALGDANVTAPYIDRIHIGGIWASPAAGSMSIGNVLFAGEISAYNSTSASNEIYYCATGACAGYNNYTINVGTDPAGPDGLTIPVTTFYDPASAMTFFQGTLGWGGQVVATKPAQNGQNSPAFYLDNFGTEASPYYLPLVATDYRWPAQRIYVTDYYDQNNGQELLSKLYVWNGTAFVPLWSAGTPMSGTDASDPYASVDFSLPPGTNAFTFYYFVGNNATESKSGGQDGPWNNKSGEWQNTVKITPRDNMLTFDGGDKTQPLFDWNGNYDDDWVLTNVNAPDEVRLNIIKMTIASNYPLPLDGCTFELFRSDSIYDDFSNIDLGDGTWTQVGGTLRPAGFLGLDNSERPVLTTGSYVLVETGAPANYSANVGRVWFLVFSGGELRMFADAALTVEIPLGTETGVDNDLNIFIYGGQVQNQLNPNTPLARVSLVKYNEDGSEQIFGQTITNPGQLDDGWFTGAVFALYKYDEAGLTVTNQGLPNFTLDGQSNGYGNTLVYGYGRDGVTMLKNWCDIEPGYYVLLELRAPQGYVTDPTPIYIYFDGATLTVNGNTHNQSGSGLNARCDIGTTDDGKPEVTVNARNTVPEYQITVNKYNASTMAPVAKVNFELYRYDQQAAGNLGELIDSFTTTAEGVANITLPGTDGKYVLHEALTPAQPYSPAPDYTIEVRGGELYIKGGPYGDDFKIVRGLRDDRYYVILEPEVRAITVYAGDAAYPPDLKLDPNDALIAGLLHATLAVPNEPRELDRGSLTVSKVVADTGDTGLFTFTIQSDGTAIDLSTEGISVDKTGGTGTLTTTADGLSSGRFSMTRDTTVTITGLPVGLYTISEDAAGYHASYKVDGGSAVNASVTGDLSVVKDTTTAVEFTNIKWGGILPKTGGMGSSSFTGGGLALMGIMAVALLVRRKAARAKGLG